MSGSAGHYIERPNVAMRWEPGHWLQQGGNWVWVDGAGAKAV